MIGGAIESPVGGNLGARTCSIFRLDFATSTIPIEPLADMIPSFTPMRVVLDLVDGEQITHEYSTTDHAIVGLGDASSHVHRRLKTMSITGRLVNAAAALAPLDALVGGPGLVGPGAVPPPATLGALPVSMASFVRFDLMRFKNLVSIANSGQPVMVVTPRFSLGRAFITSLPGNWSPREGESTLVQIAFKECRLLSPLSAAPIPDATQMPSGNQAPSGGGEQATTTVNATTTPSGTSGVPPRVNGVGSRGVVPP